MRWLLNIAALLRSFSSLAFPQDRLRVVSSIPLPKTIQKRWSALRMGCLMDGETLLALTDTVRTALGGRFGFATRSQRECDGGTEIQRDCSGGRSAAERRNGYTSAGRSKFLRQSFTPLMALRNDGSYWNVS